MGNDIGTYGTEGIEPIKRVLNYLLYSVTRFLNHKKTVSKLEGFRYKKIPKKF